MIQIEAVVGCQIEPLEQRSLFSFTTVDVVRGGEFSAGMAADAAGNVYVGGYGGPDDSVVRQSADGGATWGNILELPFLHPSGGYTEIYGIAASPAGDVYAGV